MKRLALLFPAWLLLSPTSSFAWTLETHVGLTSRAAQRSVLDGWLRNQGYETGAQEMLGVHDAPADKAIVEELNALDAALGVTPDAGRQSAIDWLLAGAALEGVGMERVRNHFLSNGRGLDERDRLASWRVRFDDVRAGLGTIRGALTGINFDGSGMPADGWVDAADNTLSRAHFIDAQADAIRGATPELRDAALARSLVYAGAILHVLECMGDPANTRNDFVTNTLFADQPLESWVGHRYGLSVPPASTALPNGRPTLVSFFHDADGSGLADEVGRTYRSPATQKQPPTQAELAATAEALLPRIGADAGALLDFLFRGTLTMRAQTDGTTKDLLVGAGAVKLGAGTIELYAEDGSGTRTKITERTTTNGDARFANIIAKKVIALYRGHDEAGEPIVVSAALVP